MSSRPTDRSRRRIAAVVLAIIVGAVAGAVFGPGLLDQNRAAQAPTEPETSERVTAEAAESDATASDRAAGAGPGERSADRERADQRDTARSDRRVDRRRGPIEWKDSTAIGTHSAGRLKDGVLLPPEGRSWVSWDPILKRRPNREWRRWGTDVLIRKTLRVMREFRAEHPNAPRIAIGDLSRPEGGDFGPQFGSIGHASHQNGLDVDVYYPRKDRRVRPPEQADQVRVDWAQDLVDAFVELGAEKVFVGPNLPLTGPPDVVVPLVHHDNHLHARLPLD